MPSLNKTNYSTDEEEFGEELDTGFIEPKSIITTPSKRKKALTTFLLASYSLEI